MLLSLIIVCGCSSASVFGTKINWLKEYSSGGVDIQTMPEGNICSPLHAMASGPVQCCAFKEITFQHREPRKMYSGLLPVNVNLFTVNAG